MNLAGLCCFDQGIFPEGLECFEKALSLVPSGDPRFQRPTILNNYGNQLTELEQFERAVAMYNEALEGLSGVSREKYLEARDVEPAHVVGTITNNVGWAHLRRARAGGKDPVLLSKAIDFLKKTLASNLRSRTRIIAAGNLVEAYLMAGDLEAADSLLSSLKKDCEELSLQRLLPEVYRRKAQLCAARREIPRAVTLSRKAMKSSLNQINPRQELRIVEVFLDILDDLLGREADRLLVLQGSGARVLNQLLSLLRSKDAYTGGDHSRRVAKLSRKMAVFLEGESKSNERWLKEVELGGLLHDIGKLRIPWSLLNQLRPLSQREMRQLQGHALAGAEILTILDLPKLATIAGEHHERFDGSGYPMGKWELSIEGSIVAVADVYEAMTSPSRRYRIPRRPKVAIAEILSQVGSKFEPRVVHALEAIILRKSRV